jgi:O-antigen/teichoic acid export membrane protein
VSAAEAAGTDPDGQDWPGEPLDETGASPDDELGLAGIAAAGIPAAGLSRRVAARNAAAFAPSTGPSAVEVQKARAAGIARLGQQVARRFSWGLGDQAMSSLSNSAVSIYILHVLGPTQFGAFGLAYVTYAFVLNASRGLGTDPLVVRYSGTDSRTWRRAVASSSGSAFFVGIVAAVLALGAAFLLSGTARLAFLGLAVTLPGLMLQDSWRYAFFAAGRGRDAFINDSIWTFSMIPGLVLLRVFHDASVFTFVMVWGSAACLGAAIGPLQAGVIPKPWLIRSWISRHRDLAPRYLAENTANSAANQLRTYAVGFIVSLAAVGYVQASNTLMGPFLVVLMGISLVTVPEAARMLRRSPRHLRLYCIVLSAVLAAAAMAWGGVLLLALPRGLGNLIVHQWRGAYDLVLPASISIAGACVIAGASAGLRALAASRRSLPSQIATSVVYLVGGVLGAYFYGATGTVYGVAIAVWIGAGVWWWQLNRALKGASAASRDDRSASRSSGRHARGRAAPAAPGL